MTTEKPTEDQEPKTAAEQGESADATGDTDQSASIKPADTASGKPGENDGDGKDGGDEVSQLRDELKTKDETITRIQQETGRAALAAQIERLEADDRAADVEDLKSVEDGNLTTTDATKRIHERRDATQSKIESEETKVSDARTAATNAVNNALIARLGYAQGYAKEFGIDVDVLNDDTTLTTPDEMRMKARELQLDERDKKATGSDKFDSGQRGAASLDVDKMDAMEKIRAGVGKMGS